MITPESRIRTQAMQTRRRPAAPGPVGFIHPAVLGMPSTEPVPRPARSRPDKAEALPRPGRSPERASAEAKVVDVPQQRPSGRARPRRGGCGRIVDGRSGCRTVPLVRRFGGVARVIEQQVARSGGFDTGCANVVPTGAEVGTVPPGNRARAVSSHDRRLHRRDATGGVEARLPGGPKARGGRGRGSARGRAARGRSGAG